MTRRSAVLLMLLMAAVAYLPIHRNALVYEDYRTVGEAMDVTAWQFVGGWRSWSALGRDIPRLSLWASSTLFGDVPQIHHAVGLSIHLLNGVLVYLLLTALVPSALGVYCGLYVFMLHPLQYEAVGYIASRPDLLMTTGLLTALWLATKPLTAWRCVGIFAAGIFAMASKQTGLMVLPLLALMPYAHRSDRLRAIAIVCVWSLCVGVAAMSFIRIGQPDTLPLDPLSRASYQAMAWWTMLSLVAWPFGRLNIDHDIGQAPLFLADLWLIALLMVGYVVVRVRNHPVWCLALTWPLLAIAPRLILPWPEFFNEHQFYSAMPAVSIGVAAIVCLVRQWWEDIVTQEYSCLT